MNRVETETGKGQNKEQLVMARKRKTYQHGNVQLKNGIWTLRYRELDHRTRKWKTKRERLGKFKTKREAQRVAEPVMARVNERNNTDQPLKAQEPVTFKRFIETRWKAYTVQAKYQPSTIDSHNSLIKCHLLPFFGEMRLEDVQPTDISDFFDAKRHEISADGKKDKVSANTMHHLYGLLHLMFDLAEQYDLIERSPVRPKLHKPETPQGEKPTLDAAQIRALLAAFDERDRLFVLLLAVTGMRVGEAMALRWMDFKAEQLELSINHTIYRQKLKQPKT